MSNTGAGIEGMRSDCAFARMVAAVLKNERFKVIDIGCAGGLADGWRVFGDRLAAVGIDGAAAEIDRLVALETNPQVRYRAGLVGLPPNHPLQDRIGGKPWWTNWADGRLAYERHAHIMAEQAAGRSPLPLDAYLDWVAAHSGWTPAGDADTDYAASFQPLAPQAATEGGYIHLPDLAREMGLEDADFLKLDIDGPDFEVLRSAGPMLERPSLLGAALEVTFVGSHDANDNSFHNVDRLMRQKGFDLFGLSVRTYASAALPWPYMADYPSQTLGGRPLQGDAIYLRDLASPVRAETAKAASAEILAKLAALFALFGLHDHAAEILIAHRRKLQDLLDLPAALDTLAAEVQANDGGAVLSYADYMAGFEAGAPRHFDVYGRRNTWMAGLMADAKETERLRARVAALEAQTLTLEDRIAGLQAGSPQCPPRWFRRR